MDFFTFVMDFDFLDLLDFWIFQTFFSWILDLQLRPFWYKLTFWNVDFYAKNVIYPYRIFRPKIYFQHCVFVDVCNELSICTLAFSRTLFLCTQCLKITEKVSFTIASEVSYVYILNGQKLIKNAKNGQFWRVFESLKYATF